MNIVIIEDELLTANDLAAGLKQLEPDIYIKAILSSVAQASAYFSQHSLPDLIFSDIQLGDGLSFEIFKNNPVDVPVIFCTAYDEYALEAFRTNGIDYILKPFTVESLRQTLQKYLLLQQKLSRSDFSYQRAIEVLQKSITQRKSSILVYQNERIIPLPVSDIALCYTHNKITLLICLDQQNYIVNHSLDELENLCGNEFFRANRQYLVNRKAIKEVYNYYARKLILKLTFQFNDTIRISKERSGQFLRWLSNSG